MCDKKVEEIYNEDSKNMCHFGISKLLGNQNLTTQLDIHSLSKMAEAAWVADCQSVRSNHCKASEILIEQGSLCTWDSAGARASAHASARAAG